MKAILASLLITLPAAAANIPVAWDPAFGAASYELTLAWGQNSLKATTTGTNYTFSNLVAGITYSINATTITAQGLRSDPSTNLFVPIPSAPIIRLNLSLQSSETPSGPWTTQTNLAMEVPADRPRTFWRTELAISR
jgi:hypothetical protein